ncbi:hypothetical protein [Algicella marina]|uniref:hypothetical protein n=1 Tax=Algicella marina TaxID=2683284 RepID=UPI0024E02352|nr:hypothetical protein [Algicella marina]
MTDRTTTDKTTARNDRSERLAAALRENLRKRKAQARVRSEGGDADPRPDETSKGDG